MSEAQLSVHKLQAELAALRARLAELEKAERQRSLPNAAPGEGEARYRDPFDRVPVGLYRTTPAGRFSAVNPALVRMLRYPDRDTLLESDVRSLYVEPGVRQRLLREIDRNGVALDLEFQLRRYDGTHIWVKENAQAVTGPDGAVLFYEGSLEDVTERKQVEAALRASEERYRTLIENMPIGVYRTTPQGQILQANPALVAMLGYSSFEELAARNLEKEGFEPGYPRSQFRERLSRDGVITGMEAAWTRKDGSTIFVRENATLTRRTDGQVFYDGTAEDISDRKRAEEELLETKRQLDHLLGSGPAVLYSCGLGPGYPTTFISENIFGLLGYRPRQFYDHPRFWQSRIHPDDVARVLDKLSSIEQEEPLSYEYRFRHSDGHYVWLHDRVTPSRGAGGEVCGLVGSWFDITDRRQAEEAREHAESQLRQSQKLQAVGQLAAGVAHDFNSLLMVILGNIELLKGRRKGKTGDTDSIDSSAWEQILNAIERGRTLVQKLLVFGRAQKSKPQLVDPNRLITETETMLRGIVGRRIKVRKILDPVVKYINADPGQIEQAIMNLVLNARDAMPEGGTLTIVTANADLNDAYVATADEAATAGHVMITVSDTGVGMSEEIRQRLFEPFFSAKPVDKGSGLGLSIVHGIVKQAGGHIKVTSELGKGSVFRLYFPAAE